MSSLSSLVYCLFFSKIILIIVFLNICIVKGDIFLKQRCDSSEYIQRMLKNLQQNPKHTAWNLKKGVWMNSKDSYNIISSHKKETIFAKNESREQSYAWRNGDGSLKWQKVTINVRVSLKINSSGSARKSYFRPQTQERGRKKDCIHFSHIKMHFIKTIVGSLQSDFYETCQWIHNR